MPLYTHTPGALGRRGGALLLHWFALLCPFSLALFVVMSLFDTYMLLMSFLDIIRSMDHVVEAANLEEGKNLRTSFLVVTTVGVALAVFCSVPLFGLVVVVFHILIHLLCIT